MRLIFNTRRFSRLFAKHSRENAKRYLMSFAVLLGVMVLGSAFLVLMVDVRLDSNTQTGFFMMILLLAGSIFTSTIFSELGDKRKAIPWLLLPASHLEKFLVGWIYSFLVFSVLYAISFYAVAVFALNLKTAYGQQREVLNLFSRRPIEAYIVYAFLNSIALWGAIYYQKLHFVKIAFAFFISLGLLILFNKTLLSILVNRPVEMAPPFGVLRIAEGGQPYDITVNNKIYGSDITLLLCSLAFVFWAAAYFRLKEKQV